jgi:hypothetical protein
MGGFNLDQLRDVSLAISGLVCDCRVWKSPENPRVGGLVTFRGRYLPGSAGKDDALWITWRLDEFYELARPDGLVVDCRELDYIWGDDLDLQPRRVLDRFPLLLVLRPDQQEAFAYPEPQESFRFDLPTALAEIDEQLRNLQA